MSDTAVAIAAPTNVYDVVQQQESQFAAVLSTDEVNWNREQQFVIQLLQGNKTLNDTAWNNQESLRGAILNIASIGISLNPAQKHAYLVPRGGKVCLDISYLGLMNIAMKAGAIEWGQAKLVYANDSYENTGIDTAPNHKQETFGDKGKIVGAYCTVKLPSGEYLTEEMDIEALDKIRSASKSANGPWKQWEGEMMRKSVVKRASKYWPQMERVGEAVQLMHDLDGNESFNVSETAPEASGPTEDQKAYFDQLIENNDSMGMYTFSMSFDLNDASSSGASTWISLLHSFPKGQKGKYGKIVNTLRDKGESMLTDYLSEIEQSLGVDDDAVLHLMSELDNDALNIIESRLPNEMVMDFNKLRGTK